MFQKMPNIEHRAVIKFFTWKGLNGTLNQQWAWHRSANTFQLLADFCGIQPFPGKKLNYCSMLNIWHFLNHARSWGTVARTFRTTWYVPSYNTETRTEFWQIKSFYTLSKLYNVLWWPTFRAFVLKTNNSECCKRWFWHIIAHLFTLPAWQLRWKNK